MIACVEESTELCVALAVRETKLKNGLMPHFGSRPCVGTLGILTVFSAPVPAARVRGREESMAQAECSFLCDWRGKAFGRKAGACRLPQTSDDLRQP